MALTIREKKLAVLWLAEQAVSNYLMEEYCKEFKHVAVDRQQRLTTQALKDFTPEEQAEFKVIDLQIPKE